MSAEDALQKTLKGHKTVSTKNLKGCPEKETNDTVSCIQRTDRKELYLEKVSVKKS